MLVGIDEGLEKFLELAGQRFRCSHISHGYIFTQIFIKLHLIHPVGSEMPVQSARETVRSVSRTLLSVRRGRGLHRVGWLVTAAIATAISKLLSPSLYRTLALERYAQ